MANGSPIAWRSLAVATVALLAFVAAVFAGEPNEHRWVVRLETPNLINTLVQSHGFEHLGQVLSHDERYHEFLLPNSTNNKIGALLSVLPGVEWFQYQHPRARLARAVRDEPPDPLFHVCWFLTDNPGVDMNVSPVWDEGWTGEGVQVAIVDNGIHYDHPDIAGKYKPENSWDFNFNRPDATSYEWESHGTTLAALAAGARNRFCSLGVAFDASIAALRLTTRDTTDALEARALQFGMQDNDIYINAWGPKDDGLRLEGPGPLALEALRYGVAHGRYGLGNVFIWAAGNGRAKADNCNYDGYANSRFTIAVGSYGFYGGAPVWAEPCASLVVSAPADGEGRRLLIGATGTSQCDQMFSGSSGSSALVGGAVALMLQQRPDFTWRDVQAVLIESAQMVDEAHPDWVENGVGYTVNHQYGFGRVDSEVVMNTAETWELLPQERSVRDMYQVPTTIPDYNTGDETLETYVRVEEDFDIESIEISVVVTHRRRGQLGISLVSPSGTESILFLPHGDRTADIDWTFTTMRCWGESSAGIWTLRIYDNERGIVGALQSWVLSIHGHNRSAVGTK